jgi:predicted metal-dependent hydrolase
MAGRRPSLFSFTPDLSPSRIATRHRYILDGQSIEYTLKRSPRRRTITFTIDEAGLRIGAPLRASQSRIESLLIAHTHWIARKLAQWQARRPPPVILREGAVVMLLGEPLLLAAAAGTIGRDGNRLRIDADMQDPVALSASVVAWLRDTAQDWFERRAAHYAPALNVNVRKIRLSNARMRWGTCHADGRILLNWRLIQMPPTLVDYVVVHELAHLREPNHSPRFWRWVAEVLPDYKSRQRELRREGHRYLLAVPKPAPPLC